MINGKLDDIDNNNRIIINIFKNLEKQGLIPESKEDKIIIFIN